MAEWIYCVDSCEGPFSSEEAAAFHAAQKLNSLVDQKEGGPELGKGRARKAIIAKVERVLDPTPGWKKFFMGGAA